MCFSFYSQIWWTVFIPGVHHPLLSSRVCLLNFKYSSLLTLRENLLKLTRHFSLQRVNEPTCWLKLSSRWRSAGSMWHLRMRMLWIWLRRLQNGVDAQPQRYLFNCSLVSNQSITWQQLGAFSHVDVVEMPAEVQTGDRTDEESWSTVSHRVWHGVGLSVSETADVLPFPTNIFEFTEKI